MIELEYIGLNYKEPPDQAIDRPEGSSNYLFIIFHTEIYLEVSGTLQLCPPGTCILYTPDHPQYYHNPKDGFLNDWLHFLDRDYQAIDTYGLPLNTPFTIEEVQMAHERIQKIEQEHLMKASNDKKMIDLLIRTLLLESSRSLEAYNTHSASTQERRIRNIRSMVMGELSKPWDVTQMADLAGLSRSRFNTVYRQIFETSPKEDLLNERMTLAKYLLSTNSYSVMEVALRVGYENIYHFSKQFKRCCGVAPSGYRKG